MRRLVLAALTLAAACTTEAPAPPAAPVAPVLATPESRLHGTWKLDPVPADDLRLDALDQILGGGPVPTDAQWSDADAAWLSWAAAVYARPPADPDRVALERFARDRAERRLVVEVGAFTVQSPDGTWRRSWQLAQSIVGPDGADLFTLQTRDERSEERVMVRFEDADHIQVGPWGKPDQLVRWVRVPSPS